MAEAPKETRNRLIRIREVSLKTGLPVSGIYSAVAEGRFPAPVKISHRCSAWPENEIETWIAERITARNMHHQANDLEGSAK
jgi:prophage regulatory protein